MPPLFAMRLPPWLREEDQRTSIEDGGREYPEADVEAILDLRLCEKGTARAAVYFRVSYSASNAKSQTPSMSATPHVGSGCW